MKRVWLFAILSLTLLAACGRREVPDQDDPPVTLRVVTSFGGEDGNRKNYEAAVAAYEAETGNLVRDSSAISNEEWKARVLTDFETGSEPDVLFFFANADAEPFIKADKVVSVEEIRREYPDYAGNMDGGKLPAASDGRHYAVPILGYWEYLYVNKTVLAECGVAEPGPDYSWDQFLADCQTIREHGLTPVACSLAEVSHYWFEFAVLNNGDPARHLTAARLDGDGRLVEDAAAASWIAGLNDIKTLYELGCFPEDTLTAGDAETTALFGEGGAAFLLDGSWKVGYFAEHYPQRLEELAVCCVPATGLRRATDTIGGISTGFFITRRAWEDPEKREAAVAFVSRLTSDEVVASFVTTELTALKSPVSNDRLDPLQQSAAEALKGATALVGAVQDTISSEARSSLFANIQYVVTGKMTAREAVATAMALNES